MQVDVAPGSYIAWNIYTESGGSDSWHSINI